MIPKKLGRFEIVREIGRGAMGQVFLAHDPKIERQVAIKTIMLPPGTPAEEAQETSRRFLREAQAAGRLLHPNIVTIFDVGEDQGVSFIAMEYIDGVTLDRHAKHDSLLPPGVVLEALAQAASALDYAHQARVIHRDVKPANLMLQRDGTLKVTDFGLAKNPSANLTQVGVLLGTPSYMSPEQIQGKELDGRSDLFSLGVALYELLTGTRPFDADSISTIIYRVLYEDPRPIAAQNPALPPEINVVIAKALAKFPEKRYSTGASMVADLRRAFASLPPATLARPFPRPAPVPPSSVAASSRRPLPAPSAPSTASSRERRPRRGSAARPPLPPSTLIAHHPIKIAAIVVTLVAGLVFFPRWVGRSGRSERGRGEAETSSSNAPVSSAAVGGGGQAHQVTIQVETTPHGGSVFLDGIPLAEPRVVLSLLDTKPHDIQARAGCMEATAEMTAADLASFSGPLVLELRPRKEPVLIASRPSGARVRLNGKDTGKSTPVEIELDGCEDQSVELRLDDHKTWSRSFPSGGEFSAMSEALKSVVLQATPKGTLVLPKPMGYTVDVYNGDTRLGRAGDPILLPEGRYTLTLKNPKLFVSESVRVSIAGGQRQTPSVQYPRLGSLTVQAQPSNCKVFVDGDYVDVTPVLRLPIASGDHRVKVVFVPNGSERELNVSVSPGEAERVVVKF
jgi:serine/threonine protein kinase